MTMPQLISSADYDRLGKDRRSLAARVRRGEIVRVRRGYYAPAAEWEKLTGKDKYGLRALAFTQLSVNEPVLCHAAAALLWGLWIVGTPTKLHAVTESSGGGRSANGVARHRGSLTNSVLRCGPFLITDKLTTTLELINKLSFAYAVAICDSSLRPFERRGQVNHFTSSGSSPFEHVPVWGPDVPQGRPLTLEQLYAGAALLPTRAARVRVAAVIDFASALSGSAGESISRVRMHQLGFPAPVLQAPFTLDGGKKAQVDFWFPQQRTVGEFDGRGKYLRDDWASGSELPDRLLAEKWREDQIRAQGVTFVRWGWAEMNNAEQLARMLRQAGLPQAWKSAAV